MSLGRDKSRTPIVFLGGGNNSSNLLKKNIFLSIEKIICLNIFLEMETLIGIFSESFWYIAPILVSMTVGLSGLINQGFKIEKGWLKQLISWVIGAALSVGAWGIKVITFGNPVWLGVVALCIVVGLSSNGLYDIPTIKNWINSWFVKKTE